MDLCNADPGANYTLATSTYSIGNATVTTSVTSDGATDGRKVTTSAVTNGTIGSNGTATHWALSDGTSVVIASGALSASVAYTTSEKWTLEAVTIAIRDAGVTADITLSGETVAYNQNIGRARRFQGQVHQRLRNHYVSDGHGRNVAATVGW